MLEIARIQGFFFNCKGTFYFYSNVFYLHRQAIKKIFISNGITYVIPLFLTVRVTCSQKPSHSTDSKLHITFRHWSEVTVLLLKKIYHGNLEPFSLTVLITLYFDERFA